MNIVRPLPAVALLLVLSSVAALAHCQIPCGIYGDQTRFELMREHVATIEKSMQQITTLSADPKANANQLVRWITNKEEHAEKLTAIVTSYFLAQRVKAPTEQAGKEARRKYLKQLELLHGIIVSAMKTKQTTDLAHVRTLTRLLHDFEAVYTGK